MGGIARVRVRTPGKHIVAFAAAALATIAAVVFATKASGGREAAPPPRAGAVAAQAVALGEFLVDLAPDRTGQVAYLKLGASANGRAASLGLIEARKDEIRERLAFLLRGLSRDDLAGEEGMRLLKEEMLRRVNLVIAPEAASEVTITDIIVQ